MDEMTEKQEVSIRIVEAIGTTTLNNGSAACVGYGKLNINLLNSTFYE